MRALADFKPPFEFYAAALMHHGMRKRLIGAAGRRRRMTPSTSSCPWRWPSRALNTPSLEGFLHWVERGETEIKRDMERGRNEVRVMTVHGAKGLEADIVILPDTTALPEAAGHAAASFSSPTTAIVFPLARKDAPRKVEGGEGGGASARA